MARPKNPTYFGKRLKKTADYLHENSLAIVERTHVYSSDLEDAYEWEATNAHVDLAALYDGSAVSDESPQDALDLLEEQTLKAFKKLGAILGYDVED